MCKRRLWRRRRNVFLLLGACAITGLIIRLYFFHRQHKSDEKIPIKQLGQHEYVDSRGMHVIVAHYFATRAWQSQNDISDDVINLNEYSPIPGEGENGEPVYIPAALNTRAKTLFHINKFNLMASDRISVDRTLPDFRKEQCQRESDTSQLPNTSVIIVFHNEAWSTLLRTIHSVINNSPTSLLHEIILVDDNSTRKYLGVQLEEYILQLPLPVHIIRTEKRVGLIRARLEGFKIAKGKILTFLDAHCECTIGWLTPLLETVFENRTRVACPIIDIIHEDTFAYLRSFDLHWGGFNWNLHFRWLSVGNDIAIQRKQNSGQPFKTPVMAGGLFAIDKSYFEEIGRYDEEMAIWGGENLELSFRVWMCGGSVEIVPCSRVGHVFRKSSPYNFPGGVANILYSNLARVAEVWMDEWKYFFYHLNPEARRMRSSINVTVRQALREKLNCHSFQWYLENVWPQHFFPTMTTFLGKIRNQKNGNCLQRPFSAESSGHVGSAFIKTCTFEFYAPQLFVVSQGGYIMTDEAFCLDVRDSAAVHPTVLFTVCNQLQHQQWTYSLERETLIHTESGLCLDLPTSKQPRMLSLQSCSKLDSQKWKLEVVHWK